MTISFGLTISSRANAAVIIGLAESLVRRPHVHIEAVLGHVDPYEAIVHDPSLSLRARGAAQATVRVLST
jgi:hypothetical protein